MCVCESGDGGVSPIATALVVLVVGAPKAPNTKHIDIKRIGRRGSHELLNLNDGLLMMILIISYGGTAPPTASIARLPMGGSMMESVLTEG